MFKIVTKKQFSEKVFLFEIEAPLIAKSRKPGNFVIVRVDKHSERMPLTIADADIERGTITLVIQEVGLSSTKLCNLNVGDRSRTTRQPNTHREIRNRYLRLWWCGCCSYAAYSSRTEGCWQQSAHRIGWQNS